MREIPGYRWIRNIEKGGMTDLVVADYEGQTVVLRMANREYEKDKKVRKSFLHGIQVLKMMEHPNIVTLVDHGRHRGTDYMSVAYHDNLNLRERIVAKDESLFSHQLHLLVQIADGVACLHDAGYLHMDLKPENILIRDDMMVILVDFDLAMRHKNKMQRFKNVAGTPSYLAPETLVDGRLGERSEIFTYGVCAYELLTRQKPFGASKPEAYRKLVASRHAKPTDMRSYRENLSPAIQNVVMKCLENDPDHRYPSMRMVLRDLKKLK